MESKDYKTTLNLPETSFSMKANLKEKEPAILAKWQADPNFKKFHEKNTTLPQFILNDGPPYANGKIHMGHAVNKILKDMICKSERLLGKHAPYVPGWDCHGLPIELNVEKKFGKAGVKITEKEFREHCRAYAASQIELQKEAFIRLGVLGDWEHPYRTMDFDFEANVVRSLKKIYDNGHVRRGLKPVHWCLDCASALAEAEVEYQDKTSPSILVKFNIVNATAWQKAFAHALPVDAGVVIWTTTPWTLPGNQAVSVNPDFDYVLAEIALNDKTESIIVAACRLSAVTEMLRVEHAKVIATVKGQTLADLLVQHPFIDKQVPVLIGDHVTDDAGTGAVHTAPSHGEDDYEVALRHGIQLENPVGKNGCYIAGTPYVEGLFIKKGETILLDVLAEKGALLYRGQISHSYPHCWRHKTPIIFLATAQWFISMDQNDLREKTLAEIQTVNWVPDWGKARIENMVKNRPDWCISRQRTWGTPLCLILHKETGEPHPDMSALFEKIAQRFEEKGIEAWHELSLAELGVTNADQYEKSLDTLDVWFDSGVVHEAVLKQRDNLSFPADVYLEGSDQHRGWFNSSLTTSVAMNGVAPYKRVLTHGFIVDGEGRKMSKSLGNVVAPDDVLEKYGADIIRLWAASLDYKVEMNLSDEILNRTADAYRRIRNTARFLLANLNGFTQADCLPTEKLLPLDRYILDVTAATQDSIQKMYSDFEFHHIYQRLHQFCVVDLGSFYLDIIKDRQYTAYKESLARLSAQTALFHIVNALSRWLWPILSFTAEELWPNIPGVTEKSIAMAKWYQGLPTPNAHPVISDEAWHLIRAVRTEVNKALETQRAEKKIGAGLQAVVTLYADEAIATILKKLEDELRFVLITSDAIVKPFSEKPNALEVSQMTGLAIQVQPSTDPKCERCWHYRADVGQDSLHPSICVRCVCNLSGPGEVRHFA